MSPSNIPLFYFTIHILRYIKAVSYTHLDVYKRQGYTLSFRYADSVSAMVSDAPRETNVSATFPYTHWVGKGSWPSFPQQGLGELEAGRAYLESSFSISQHGGATRKRRNFCSGHILQPAYQDLLYGYYQCRGRKLLCEDTRSCLLYTSTG